MEQTKYVSNKEAVKLLGVHYTTLHTWEKKGMIDAIRVNGGKRLYDVEGFLKKNKKPINNTMVEETVPDTDTSQILETDKKVCYCRVSSPDKKKELDSQVNYMITNYPDYELIKDYGTSIDFNRLGLRKLFHYIIEGKLKELVIVDKSSLCKYGFELMEELIEKYSKGKITLINKVETETNDDLMEILVLKSHKNIIKK